MTGKEPTMKTHLAYCAACDREVRVTLRRGYRPRQGEPIPAEALECLAHGDACTGALCPLFGAYDQAVPGEPE
jgi:hypothetical protein